MCSLENGPEQIVLEAKAVTKRFGSLAALDLVDFQLMKGKIKRFLARTEPGSRRSATRFWAC